MTGSGGCEQASDQTNDLSSQSQFHITTATDAAPAAPSDQSHPPPSDQQSGATSEANVTETTLPSFDQLSSDIQKNDKIKEPSASLSTAQSQQASQEQGDNTHLFQKPLVYGQYDYQPMNHGFHPQWLGATSTYTPPTTLAYAPQGQMSYFPHLTPPSYHPMNSTNATFSGDVNKRNEPPLYSPVARRPSSLLQHYTPPPSDKEETPSKMSTPVMPPPPSQHSTPVIPHPPSNNGTPAMLQPSSISTGQGQDTPNLDKIDSKNLAGQVRAMGLKVENMEDPPMCHICWHMCCLPGSVKKHIVEIHDIPIKEIGAIRTKSELIAAGFAVPADIKPQRARARMKKKKPDTNHQQADALQGGTINDNAVAEGQYVLIQKEPLARVGEDNSQNPTEGLSTVSPAPKSKPISEPKQRGAAHFAGHDLVVQQTDRKMASGQHQMVTLGGQQLPAREVAQRALMLVEDQPSFTTGMLVPPNKSAQHAMAAVGRQMPRDVDGRTLQDFTTRSPAAAIGSSTGRSPDRLNRLDHPIQNRSGISNSMLPLPTSNGSIAGSRYHVQPPGSMGRHPGMGASNSMLAGLHPGNMAQDPRRANSKNPHLGNLLNFDYPPVGGPVPLQAQPSAFGYAHAINQHRIQWTHNQIHQYMQQMIAKGEPYRRQDLELVARAAFESMNFEQQRMFNHGVYPTSEQLEVAALRAINAELNRQHQQQNQKRSYDEFAREHGSPSAEVSSNKDVASFDPAITNGTTPDSPIPQLIKDTGVTFQEGDASVKKDADTPHKRQKTSYGEILVPDMSPSVAGPMNAEGDEANKGEEASNDIAEKKIEDKLRDALAPLLE